jgi:ADP-ribose pyrophosphatase YjhB (NUDIX family)
VDRDDDGPAQRAGRDLVTAPRLLDWARRLQAIAQSGVAYDEPSPYDRDRYAQVRRIAAEMLASNGDVEALDARFALEAGHATPKLDVRGAVFRDDAILLVREAASSRWTLPGGWVDVGESPSEAVVREVREESGYETRAVKLLALYDRDRHPHPPHQWHTWKACFLCELVDEVRHAHDHEVSEVGFFARDALPELDIERITPDDYVNRFFAHREHPEWPTDFD